VNQGIEVGGLEKRCRGRGKGIVRIDRGARMEKRIEASVRMRVKVRMEVEWVLSIYLVEINK
jgi:hypothetical protein